MWKGWQDRLHKHHIVFKSQGGLDFELNYKRLTLEEHEGNNGPHLNKIIDNVYKRELQNKLYEIFYKDEYQIEEIALKLGRTTKYFEKHFKRVPNLFGTYKKEDIIIKLMGGRLY